MQEGEEGINTTEKSPLIPGKQSEPSRPQTSTRRLYPMKRWSFKQRVLGVTALQVVAVIAIALGVTLSITLKVKRPPISYAGSYARAAVATDAAECSQIGVDILQKGGSAVDSAIASLLCVGVMNPQSTGIGGGGFLVYYNATSNLSTVIDFRETAPGNITEQDMEKYKNIKNSTVYGGMAIGVPGEMRGIGEAWKRFGKLPWNDLLQPTIQLARDGFPVSKAIASAISSTKQHLTGDQFTGLKQLLAPADDETFLKEGDIIKNKELADTLELLASKGADYFYNSSFTEEMVKELNEDYGCLLSVEDFKNYTVHVKNATVSEYGNLRVHGVPPPASGAVLGLMLNILSGYSDLTLEDEGLSYHRIVEAFKFSYAQHSRLGDPAFNKTVNEVAKYMLNASVADWMKSRITDDNTHDTDYYKQEKGISPLSHGTTHLVVLAENGDAVSVTSTVNLIFGSLVRSTKNGIIFNNEIDDFSVPGRNNSFGYPPSVPNYIEPNKRPQSSTVPTIIERNGSVVLVVGAAGGSRIPTATAQLIIDVLNFDTTLDVAITLPRIHHQLLPDILYYETELPEKYLNGLRQRGHTLESKDEIAVVQAIFVDERQEKFPVQAVSDPRKGGKPAGY